MAVKRVRTLGNRLFQADACYEQTTVSQLTRFEVHRYRLPGYVMELADSLVTSIVSAIFIKFIHMLARGRTSAQPMLTYSGH